MKPKNLFYAVFAAIALILLYLFLSEREKNKRTEKIVSRLSTENMHLKHAYFDLLKNMLENVEGVPKGLVEDLNRLRSQALNLPEGAHEEINSAILQLKDGNSAKAIREIAKVIEATLKDRLVNEPEYKKGCRLKDMFQLALDKNLINVQQHHSSDLIRELRNKESHELNVKIERHKAALAIYVGIDIIYQLAS